MNTFITSADIGGSITIPGPRLLVTRAGMEWLSHGNLAVLTHFQLGSCGHNDDLTARIADATRTRLEKPVTPMLPLYQQPTRNAPFAVCRLDHVDRSLLVSSFGLFNTDGTLFCIANCLLVTNIDTLTIKCNLTKIKDWLL